MDRHRGMQFNGIVRFSWSGVDRIVLIACRGKSSSSVAAFRHLSRLRIQNGCTKKVATRVVLLLYIGDLDRFGGGTRLLDSLSNRDGDILSIVGDRIVLKRRATLINEQAETC